jgi:hypothetical protein
LRKLVTKKLKEHAAYLAVPDEGVTIESIVESLVIQAFEADHKRSMKGLDFANVRPFKIPTLMANPQHGFSRKRLALTPYVSVFHALHSHQLT